MAGAATLTITIPAAGPSGASVPPRYARTHSANAPSAAEERTDVPSLAAERAEYAATSRASRSLTRAQQHALLIQARRVYIQRRGIAQRGKPYSYGAAGPDRFDCSGLTLYVYLGTGPRLAHSAAGISATGMSPVSRPLIGDIAYWGGRGSAYHVGIVIWIDPRGVPRVVDAPGRGTRVTIRPPWTGVRYLRLQRMT